MLPLLKLRYQVLQVLSDAGGFGQTFLAEDKDTPSHRRCVIKKLKPITNPDDFKYMQERFQREAAILERLGEFSDQIPKLYAYFIENEEFYLVQEFIDGLTLRQKVRQEGRLSEDLVKELLISLLNVLAYVHEQKIIHRDIKPDNIILRRRDKKPVLIDFGIVKEVLRVDADGNPTSTMMAGTLGYTSLEQAAGRPVFASDLYGLGATAIFLLTGKNPQQMADITTGEIHWRQLVPNANPDLATVLNKATESLPRDRYQTANEMLEDLCRVVWRNSQSTPSIVSPRNQAKSIPKIFAPVSTARNPAIADVQSTVEVNEADTVVRPVTTSSKLKINSLLFIVPTILLLLFAVTGGSYWLWSLGTNTNNLLPEEAIRAGVVATVNGKSIMLSEVDRILNRQLKGKQDELPFHELYQARLQILNNLIEQEVLFQRAEKAGLLPTESEITDSINNTESESQEMFNLPTEYEKRLKESESGISDRELVKKRLAINKLINKETSTVGAPSDREVEDFFVNNRNTFIRKHGENVTLDKPGVWREVSDTLVVRAKNIVVQALLETAKNEASIVNYFVAKARSTSGFTSRSQND
jgi:serine/threonine protein kinase